MLDLRNTDKEGNIDRNFSLKRIYYGRVYYG